MHPLIEHAHERRCLSKAAEPMRPHAHAMRVYISWAQNLLHAILAPLICALVSTQTIPPLFIVAKDRQLFPLDRKSKLGELFLDLISLARVDRHGTDGCTGVKQGKEVFGNDIAEVVQGHRLQVFSYIQVVVEALAGSFFSIC